jgi:hypothetical protein
MSAANAGRRYLLRQVSQGFLCGAAFGLLRAFEPWNDFVESAADYVLGIVAYAVFGSLVGIVIGIFAGRSLKRYQV